MNPSQPGGDVALQDAVTRCQQNDQVTKQARLLKEGHKEGQYRPQKRREGAMQVSEKWSTEVERTARNSRFRRPLRSSAVEVCCAFRFTSFTLQ